MVTHREPLEKDPRDEVWSAWPGAVLLSDEIKYYSTSPEIPESEHLIYPFDNDRLEAARYNLRLGCVAHLGGERRELSDKNPELVLRPHQVAVVQTFEEIRLPRFLIARWNLKVKMVYEGLLWTGALQVDPGWHGHLYCPLYNLAERDVVLTFKKELFAMDFVRTTQFKPGESKPYEQKRWSIEDCDIHRLKSAPYEVLSRLDSLQEELTDLANQSRVQMNIIFTVLAVIVAALAVFFGAAVLGNTEPLRKLLPDLGSVATLLAGLALIISAIALFWSMPFRRRNQRGSTGQGKPK